MRPKPVSSATETSKKIGILLVASSDMILYKERMTMALIRLRGCAGWSAPLLFANHRRQVFSHRGPYHLLYPLLVHLKRLCIKQCGPRSDCSSGFTLFVCMPKLVLDVSIYKQQTTCLHLCSFIIEMFNSLRKSD